MYICRICGSEKLSKTFDVREMMFGTRDVFSYAECADCKSLQISELPSSENLGKYYPDNYYSHHANEVDSSALRRAIRAFAEKYRDAHIIENNSVLGYLIETLRPTDVKMASLKGLNLHRESAILDLGCGTSALLLNRLAAIGFRNLVGVDPFVSADLVTPAGVKVLKRRIEDVAGQFDLIMMHHSFEHMTDHLDILLRVKALLRIDGRCLIRVPTPSSEAYETYRENWVQLDAPRHLALISNEGMHILADQAGFAIERSFDDSDAFQFVASELYKRDVPLVEQNPTHWFSKKDIKVFEKRAAALNAKRRGDRFCFILVNK